MRRSAARRTAAQPCCNTARPVARRNAVQSVATQLAEMAVNEPAGRLRTKAGTGGKAFWKRLSPQHPQLLAEAPSRSPSSSSASPSARPSCPLPPLPNLAIECSTRHRCGTGGLCGEARVRRDGRRRARAEVPVIRVPVSLPTGHNSPFVIALSPARTRRGARGPGRARACALSEKKQ